MCEPEEKLIVTTPFSGMRTTHDTVTVRGFLCIDYPFVEIRNETTEKTSLAPTLEVCDDLSCAYYFAAPIRELALGSNQIKAVIPGNEPGLEVEIEVIRTGLASLE